MFTSLSRYMRVRKGITLAELMLVIAVIALLAAVIYPASAWYMSRARDSDRKNDVQNAAIHLSNFFTDYRSYPEPDETGCLAPDVFRGTTYKNILLESAPNGNTVDSSNPCVGKYAYGTSTGDTAYILVAYLENKYAGNYSGSTQGMLGRGRVTRQWWENAQAAQSSGSVQGDKFVYSAGVFQDAPMVFADGACQQTHRWVLFSMNHGEEKIESITDVTSPANGGTTYTVKATCTNAALTLEETSLIRCNDNYVLSQGGCIAQVTDCPSKIVESFSVPALAHGSSTGVTATESMTGGTITHTATASCDNGTVNIEGQNSIVACNEGYIPTAGQCVFTQNTCDSQTKDGFPVPALAHGSSTGVTATESMTGGTITHTANASCDNGTVNIKDQTSTVECNEGYKEDETTSPHSCKEVPGFTTVWNIGWATSGVNNTISFRIATHSGATVTIYGNNGVKLATSTGGVVTLSGTGLANGENRIRIVGDLAQFSTHAFPSTAYALKKVTDWGGVKWKSMKNMFYGAANLVTLPTEAPDLNSVTDMWGMFYYATSFNQPLNSWNVSNVTNMNSMFVSATSFNQALNNWDVSKVTNMSSMFYWATSFNQPLNSWNVSNVTNMNSMFVSATAFNRDINSWNVSKVTDMSSMFYWATSFNQPIGNWNVSKVTDMREMFAYASTFDQNIHSWCADKIPSKPEAWSDEYWDNEAMVTYGNSWVAFDDGTPSGFRNQAHKQPQWWGCVMSGFTTKWKIGAGYETRGKIEFEIEATGPVTIDWGDGTKEVINDSAELWNHEWFSSYSSNIIGTASHVYTTDGEKIVKISGPLTRFWNENYASRSVPGLIAVTDWGEMQWTSMENMFRNANNFESVPLDTPILTHVTNMSGMFHSAWFNQNINHWDVSNITDMSYMFSHATSFNQPLNDWDVSGVKDMGRMFKWASSFNQDIGNWKVNNVTDMREMFAHASTFDQNIHSWCADKIPSKPSNFDAFSHPHFMSQNSKQPQWWGCKPFTTTWKVGATGYGNGDRTIQFAIASTGPVKIDWGDGTIETKTSGTHSHTYTTAGDKTVKISGPLTRWYNPSWSADHFGKLTAVTDWGGIHWASMERMFAYANKLNALPTEAPDLSSVTNMNSMFWGATSFNQPLNSWNVSKVTDMWWMFSHATSFNQPLNSWNVSNVTNMNYMFSSATSFNQPIGNWDVSKVTNMSYMFHSATSFNQPIGNWNVSKVTNMNGMFYWATSFNQPLNDWNTSNVTNMSTMFSSAISFDQPLNSWNVSKVTDMWSMFSHATSFNQPIGNWDVSKVTSMYGMFSSATSFNQPIGNWDVSKVTNMSYMFHSATSFNQPIGNWDVSKVTDMRQMFAHASRFNQNIRSWCVPHIASKPLANSAQYIYSDFDTGTPSGFRNQAHKQPRWGCTTP